MPSPPFHLSTASHDYPPIPAYTDAHVHSPLDPPHSPYDSKSSEEFYPAADGMESPITPSHKEHEAFFSSPPVLIPGNEDGEYGGLPPVVNPNRGGYVPVPFTRTFAISVTSFMVFLAVGVEVLHSISQAQYGFSNNLAQPKFDRLTHFIYTAATVGVSLPVVALWGTCVLRHKRREPSYSLPGRRLEQVGLRAAELHVAPERNFTEFSAALS
ncbi:hypothetical protein P7C70_g1943, partial [Phenoliferia sp. Uapishka_3]